MWKEFKEFALKGNIMNLAVGIIIGGAFQKIVSSLVNDIIMPTFSAFTGNVDLTSLSINIGEVSIKYGAFLAAILDFLFIAFCIFLIIRYVNKLNKKLEEITEEGLKKLEKKGKLKRRKKGEVIPPPTTKLCPYCFSEINIKASRCSSCTSSLEKNEEQKTVENIEEQENNKTR